MIDLNAMMQCGIESNLPHGQPTKTIIRSNNKTQIIYEEQKFLIDNLQKKHVKTCYVACMCSSMPNGIQ